MDMDSVMQLEESIDSAIENFQCTLETNPAWMAAGQKLHLPKKWTKRFPMSVGGRALIREMNIDTQKALAASLGHTYGPSLPTSSGSLIPDQDHSLHSDPSASSAAANPAQDASFSSQ